MRSPPAPVFNSKRSADAPEAAPPNLASLRGCRRLLLETPLVEQRYGTGDQGRVRRN
jgi:hypothetical protein